MKQQSAGLRALSFNAARIGAELASQGKLTDAVAYFHSALLVNPEDGATLLSLGKVLRRQGQLRKARACFDRAIQLEPENPWFHASLGALLLLQGEFQAGWREFEWVWQIDVVQQEFSDLGKPLWDGSALGGRTCLVRGLFGFGDNIQWARYAVTLAAQGGRIVLECQPELVRLMRTLKDLDVVALNDPLPAIDVYAPLLSLPHLMGLTAPNPSDVPYLRAPDDDMAHWRRELRDEDVVRVGLVWASDPSHPTSQWRSIRLADLTPILAVAGAKFFSLQKGTAAEQMKAESGAWITYLGPHLKDFADTAGLLTQLDLVVTVDTAVAHLAGAMGRPVWVLVCAFPDSRWLMQREDSPWYPTARLFRQERPGDWTQVVERVAEELAMLCSLKRSEPQ